MLEGTIADRRIVYQVLGSAEVPIPFASIREGMKIRMIESDGEPVTADGCMVLIAVSDAYQNDEGIWTVSIEPCGLN